MQKDNLPDYFYRFLELSVVLTADHGPAVSGAHNTIIAARAGKDLVSSLVSGLLTVVRTLLSTPEYFTFKLSIERHDLRTNGPFLIFSFYYRKNVHYV